MLMNMNHELEMVFLVYFFYFKCCTFILVLLYHLHYTVQVNISVPMSSNYARDVERDAAFRKRENEDALAAAQMQVFMFRRTRCSFQKT